MRSMVHVEPSFHTKETLGGFVEAFRAAGASRDIMGLLTWPLVVLSAKNDFKSELGGLVDSSIFRKTTVSVHDDALVCATLPLPLSYRLGPHVTSEVVETGDGEVAFYRDDGKLATLHTGTGAYGTTVAAAAPPGVVPGSADNGTFYVVRPGGLAGVRLADGSDAGSCAIPNGTDATAGSGSWWAAFGGGTVVIAKNHCLKWPLEDPQPGAVHFLEPVASGACGHARSWTLPSVNDSFCGAAS